MKKIPFDNAAMVIGVSVLAISIAAGWMVHERSVLKQTAAQRNASIQTFEYLSLLKMRWGVTPEIKRKRAFLMAHPALVRQESRQKSLRLEYANLSQHEFDRIISTLMNTPFVITKLNLARSSNNTGTIIVEIEK